MARDKSNKTIVHAKLLLVEGEDEVNFFRAWFTELLIQDVQVLEYSGKTRLAEFLLDLTGLPGFSKVQRIAITRDADDSASSAKDSLRAMIEGAPDEIRQRAIDSFVLPNDQSPGALEALWLASLDADPMAECVNGFFRCIEEKGWHPSQVWAKNDKARAQVWIATKDTPNERLGHAAWHGRKNTGDAWMKEKWVDFTHQAFHPLKLFLARALDLPIS